MFRLLACFAAERNPAESNVEAWLVGLMSYLIHYLFCRAPDPGNPRLAGPLFLLALALGLAFWLLLLYLTPDYPLPHLCGFFVRSRTAGSKVLVGNLTTRCPDVTDAALPRSAFGWWRPQNLAAG